MTKEQYERMLRLRLDVHSTYGIPPKHPGNLQELYEEYIKLRKLYADCKGKIDEERN